MGCVNSLQQSKFRSPSGERTQTYRIGDSGIELNQDKSNYSSVLYQSANTAKIIRKGTGKLPSSIIEAPQSTDSTNQVGLMRKNSKQEYWRQNKSFANAQKQRTSKDMSGNSTLESINNARHQSYNSSHMSKENAQNNNQVKKAPQQTKHKIIRISSLDRKQTFNKVQLYQKQSPLPIVEEVSLQQIDSALIKNGQKFNGISNHGKNKDVPYVMHPYKNHLYHHHNQQSF